MSLARQLTYLVADLRSGLHGLGGAFFILLFDPTSPVESVLDVARPCALGTGWGISAACPSGDGAVVAFGDCMSPSLSSTSMVSTLELTVVVVSADTADLVRFSLLFFRLRNLGCGLGGRNLPCYLLRVQRRGDPGWHPTRCGGSLVVTPNRRVRDVLVDGKRWCHLRVCHVVDFVVVLVLVAQRRRAPVDAFAVLQNKT
jgi:hypothetical protein